MKQKLSKGCGMTSDQELWKDFSEFRMNECLGLWSNAVIHLPFGKLCLFHPDDSVCLLQNADIRELSPQKIVQDVDAFASSFGLKAGFMFSSAWQGDIETFRAYISSIGYSKNYEQSWIIKENFDDIDAISDSEFFVEETNDSIAVSGVFCESFSASEALGQLIRNKMDSGLGPVQTRFILARDFCKKPVACIGYSYESPFGYMHCNGTLKEFRGHGIYRHIIKAGLQKLRHLGMQYAIAEVSSQNKALLRILKNNFGFRVFEKTENWKKGIPCV